MTEPHGKPVMGLFVTGDPTEKKVSSWSHGKHGVSRDGCDSERRSVFENRKIPHSEPVIPEYRSDAASKVFLHRGGDNLHDEVVGKTTNRWPFQLCASL